MADQTIFGAVPGISPDSATFHIYKVLTNGTASPEVIFNAANPVPHNFRVIGFEGWNNTGAAQAGATFTLQSNLNNAGLFAVSDALAVALQDSKAYATTISAPQSLLTLGSAVEDILNVAKNAGTNAGIVLALAFIR